MLLQELQAPQNSANCYSFPLPIRSSSAETVRFSAKKQPVLGALPPCCSRRRDKTPNRNSRALPTPPSVALREQPYLRASQRCPASARAASRGTHPRLPALAFRSAP